MKKITLLSVLLLMTSLIFAQLIHVPGEYSSIQIAIDAASDGDTVLVAEGTYFENIDFIGKAITIASQFILDDDASHISKTIIDGSQPTDENKASVVTLRSGEDTTSVLLGFTITGGKGTFDLEDYPMGSGGGILIHGSGGKITHNIIENNHMGPSAEPLLPYSGGGIHSDVFNDHTAIIRQNIIRNNRCTGDIGSGGGAHLTGGRIIFENNSVMDNTLSMRGDASGAGLFWQWHDYDGYIDEVIFRKNIISSNAGYSDVKNGKGGGLMLNFAYKAKVELYNNVICDNYTEGLGGGIFFNNAGASINNNTIANNEATENGNTLSVYIEGWGNELVLYNNILWSDVQNEISDINLWGSIDTHASFYYNMLKESILQEDSAIAIDNCYKEPKFKKDSYELAQYSSAIGRGIDSVQIDGIWYYVHATDILGNVRPNPIDPYIDLGAYESNFLFTGLRDLQTRKHRIYPNPFSTSATLELDEYKSICKVEMLNILGETVKIIDQHIGSSVTIQRENLPSGIYFLKIYPNQTYVMKVLID